MSWNTPGRTLARENQCDHQRRRQDETQEEVWSPNIWQGKASMTCSTSGWKKKTLRSAGIKVCPGCMSHCGLPQHIQMGFPERRQSHKQEHKWSRKRGNDEYLKISPHIISKELVQAIFSVENFNIIELSDLENLQLTYLKKALEFDVLQEKRLKD